MNDTDRPSYDETWALPEIDLAKCDHCGSCVERCPAGAVEMSADGPTIARPENCTYCAECDAFCPQGAVTCTYEIVWEAGAQPPATH
jgi:ferredoxin